MKFIIGIGLFFALAAVMNAQTLLADGTAYSLSHVDLCDTVVPIQADTLAREVTVEARASAVNDRERMGESPSAWGLQWADGLKVMLRSGNTAFGEPFDERYARVTVAMCDSVVADRRFTSGFSMRSRQPNSLVVTRGSDGAVTVRGGRGALLDIASFMLSSEGTGGSVSLVCDGLIRVTGCVAEWEADRQARVATSWTFDSLCARFAASGDPLEGFWEYFDRRNDPDYARRGGRYVIAVVAENAGYTVLYVDGAEVNRSAWRSCMRKGRLSPTVFSGQYDLEWIDAMMEPVESEMNARIEHDALLVMEFPLLKSRLRFSKMPAAQWDMLR